MELHERKSESQELARSSSGAPYPACPGQPACSSSNSKAHFFAHFVCVCARARADRGEAQGAGGWQRALQQLGGGGACLASSAPCSVPTVRKRGLTFVRELAGHASAGALGGAAGGGCGGKAEQHEQGGGPGAARAARAPLQHGQGAAGGMLLAGLQDESTSADYPPPHV